MATLLEYEITGSHTGANNVAVLTDSTASFLTRRVHTNDIIYNLTDGSSATITNVTATIISGVLAGGAQNDWDTGDLYRIWVSEPNQIRHTYTDTRGFPAAAEITVCSPLDIAKDTYRDYQKIRLTDAESGLIYFYGKIESGESAFDSFYGQVINLFARDNISEILKKVINTNYSDATTLKRGRATAGGGESIGLINKLIVNHAYSVTNIDTTSAGFESSAVTEAANVLDQNYIGTGKTVLKGIQELANEDPWDATPTGFGFDFYLDTAFSGSAPAPKMQYFKRNTRPVGGASANGLTVELNAVDADQKRSMFMDYFFPIATKELITRVRVEYVDNTQASQTKTIYLLDVSARVNAPFTIDSVITGGTSGVTAVVEYDGSTFLCVSTLTGTGIWTIGETISNGAKTAVVDRSPRQTYEQDIEIVLHGYNIVDVSEARKRAAQILYHAGNTITRGTFKIAKIPYFKIAGVYTQVRAGHVIRVKNINLGLDEDMLVTKIVFDEGPGILFSIIDVLRIGRGAGAEKTAFDIFTETDQTALWSSFARSGSGSTRVELNTGGLFGYNGTTKEFYLQASDGKAYFGAGAVVADVSGLTIDENGGATKYIIFKDVTNILGWLYGSSAADQVFLETDFTTTETGIGIGAGVAPLTDSNTKVHISAGSAKNVKLSASSANGNEGYILIVSKKTTTGDPTGTEGKLYWNEFDNVLKIYADGGWRTITTW